MIALPEGKQKELFNRLKGIRSIGKSVNYASQYQAGPSRLSITAGISLAQAKVLHDAYWNKNWAWKAVAEDQEVKQVGEQMWLKNPINGFYYSLRNKRDIGSTLVQGTASYVFDLWIGFVLQERDQITFQFHDEGGWEIWPEEQESFENILNQAIKDTNDLLKLNRELGITIQTGTNYAQIH